MNFKINKIIYPFISLLVFSTSYLIFNNIRIRKELNAEKRQFSESNTYSEFLHKTLSTRDFLFFQAEVGDINLESRLVSINSDTITIRKLLGGRSVLFFKITDNSCPACVDREITLLEKHYKQTGLEETIILASYKNSRYFKLFQQNHNDSFRIFRMIDEDGFPEVMGEVPFLFVIDKNQETKFFFFPEKELPDLSEQYYYLLGMNFRN